MAVTGDLWYKPSSFIAGDEILMRQERVIMLKNIRILTLILGAVALGACGTTRPVDTGAGAPPVVDEGAQTDGVGDGTLGAGEEFGSAGRQDLLDQRIIYFAYDRADILPQFSNVLAAHADYLAAKPGLVVRLEGHADERGSREYNIGLGERRAQAVRRILMIQGSSGNQLSTVSYGEERPAVSGSGEEVWGRNRRVELVY